MGPHLRERVRGRVHSTPTVDLELVSRARPFSRANFTTREANPRRRCASPKSLFFDFDEENNLYGDYVHMDGKARRYSAAVMRAAAAWLREALAALSECMTAP